MPILGGKQGFLLKAKKANKAKAHKKTKKLTRV